MTTYINRLFKKHKYILFNKFFQIKAIYKNEKEKLDPLSKITDKFTAVFAPYQSICLDEGIGPFRGRFKYLCYNPQKPEKWGIKFFTVADSQTGYCLKAIPYLGKETCDSDNERCSTDRIVKELLKDYEKMNHKLYFDNYYCHPSLVQDLRMKSIFCTGTFRKTRKDIPEVLKNLKDSSLQVGKTKICCYEDNIICGTWKDKRNVNMITSFDSFKSATYINQNGKLTTKPHVIFNYNQNMRGVDLLNQLCSYYRYFIDLF